MQHVKFVTERETLSGEAYEINFTQHLENFGKTNDSTTSMIWIPTYTLFNDLT